MMIFDKHPEMGTKWDRSFWARGYYVTTVGDIDKEVVRKYSKTAGRKLQRRTCNQIASFRGSKYRFATQPLGVYRAVLRPPLEVVVV